jgi:aspartyl-tRNA(Asn)/glutamyl-tRNA(Gln) amidotransferase subunit A
MVHASLGSDTGGSIRCPAAVSGLVGLVPTYGRVSRRGAMPMSFSLDCVGPLARTARDCTRVLGAIAGHDPADGSSLDAPVADYEKLLDGDAPLPRIGFARGYFDDGLHPEVARAVEAAADELRRIGFVVEEVRLPADLLTEVAELHPLVMKAEGAANHMDTMRTRQEDYTFEVGHRLHAGFFIPATHYIRALKLRGEYVRAFAAAAFANVDLLLTPTLAIPAPTIAETSGKTGKAYLDMVVALTRNTKVVNYFGFPALTVPCGFTANGMPTAFQLIGRPLDEATLLRAADRYQAATGWHLEEPALVARPPVTAGA